MDAKDFYAHKRDLLQCSLEHLSMAIARVEQAMDHEEKNASAGDTHELEELHAEINTARSAVEGVLSAVVACIPPA